MGQSVFNIPVEEVIQFSKGFQVERFETVLNDVVLIKDFKTAEHLAFEEIVGEDEYNWRDIKELEMSKVWNDYYSMSESKKPKGLEELLDIIAENVRKSSFEYGVFYHDVVADLHNCAINRAINGKTNSFFEKIFEIYQFGAFPCGWSGDYPEGKIVAYKFDEVS
ncbi:hypothetical protein ACSYGW_13760 [Bacillus glycinifermentans]|uniref:hypothetical protein n=1 Tax=Bacillus glycinifermentans TaxID=1664069 RepID=UPI001FF3B187|nr:hypothetical protein [Bacillus glycinifermentans]UOY89847.1 hypothetical protein MW696_06390 [Bacillus glycinifermentans]